MKVPVFDSACKDEIGPVPSERPTALYIRAGRPLSNGDAMGFSFRKSINLGGGSRLNVGKKSFGISTGIKGVRVGVNTSGRRYVSVSIPGTGLRYSKTIGGGNGQSYVDEDGDEYFIEDEPPRRSVLSILFGFFVAAVLLVVAFVAVLAWVASIASPQNSPPTTQTETSEPTTDARRKLEASREGKPLYASRPWTINGRPIVGKLKSYGGGKVRIETDAGETLNLTPGDLSAADVEFVNRHLH